MIFCPIAGIFSDKFGKRGLLLITSAIFVTIAHILFLLTPDTDKPIFPIFYLVMLGIGYAICTTVIWACVSYSVSSDCLGTAFGMGFALNNSALVAGPLIIGSLIENTDRQHGYFWASAFLAALGVIGIISGLIIYFKDIENGGLLDAKQSDATEDNNKNQDTSAVTTDASPSEISIEKHKDIQYLNDDQNKINKEIYYNNAAVL